MYNRAMKLIIAGGRDFTPSTPWYNLVDNVIHNFKITEIVSGGCRGADAFGEEMARRNSIPAVTFKADWNAYGKAAGPIRNKAMAQYADAVILLPGGVGTDSMRHEAKSAGIKIIYDARSEA